MEGSSENKLGMVMIAMNILSVILGVRRNNQNVPLMNTDEMYARLNILKFGDMFHIFEQNFIIFAVIIELT